MNMKEKFTHLVLANLNIYSLYVNGTAPATFELAIEL